MSDTYMYKFNLKSLDIKKAMIFFFTKVKYQSDIFITSQLMLRPIFSPKI